MEVHPAGWLDGNDTPGNLGGVADVSPPGDMISQIMINWGEMGIEYNFGELLPGSISGRIHADDGPDCDFDDPHHMLEGVQVDLLDGQGNVIATTYTNADGEYAVHRLAAGHVQRPRASAGRSTSTAASASARSAASSSDVDGLYSIFTGIDARLRRERHSVRLLREAGRRAVRLRVHRRCADFHERTRSRRSKSPRSATASARADDTPLAGVVARTATGPNGRTDLDRRTRSPGSYSGAATDPIRVVTDANGYYHFGGLRAGLVCGRRSAAGGRDRQRRYAGHAGRLRREPGRRFCHERRTFRRRRRQAIIEQFRADFGNDAIVAHSAPVRRALAGKQLQRSDDDRWPPPPPPPPEPPPPPPKPPVFGPPGVPPIEPLLVLASGR